MKPSLGLLCSFNQIAFIMAIPLHLSIIKSTPFLPTSCVKMYGSFLFSRMNSTLCQIISNNISRRRIDWRLKAPYAERWPIVSLLVYDLANCKTDQSMSTSRDISDQIYNYENKPLDLNSDDRASSWFLNFASTVQIFSSKIWPISVTKEI